MEDKKCDCYHDDSSGYESGEYVCYCNKVTEKDIINAIKKDGAASIDEVIRITGANVNSNCAINNPKGTCCYKDIEEVFNRNK